MTRPRKRLEYTVRTISIADGEAHLCSGRIVAVVQSTYNPDRRMWYLTVLVERAEGG